MKKRFLFSVLVALTLLGFSAVVTAQTDITSTVLTNAGFDVNCRYVASAEAANLGSANNGANLHAVEGWTLSTTGNNSAASTFEFGYAGTLNISGAYGTIPATGYDDPSSVGCLGISAAWSATISYVQEVTLVAGGKYGIEYVAYNSGPNAADYSKVGWIPDNGTPVLSTKTSFTMAAWDTETVYFTVPDNATGKIQVGIGSPDAGSGGVGRIFFDWVKLTYYGVDKTELTTLIDEATTLYGTGEGNKASDLNAAIEVAQAVLDNGSATMSDVLTAIDNLKAAILAYKYANATATEPLDCTFLITNPSFESDFTGWTNAGMATQGNESFKFVLDGVTVPLKDGSKYIEKWISYNNGAGKVADVGVAQTVANLPNGKYSLTVSAQAIQESNPVAAGTGGFIFAGSKELEVGLPAYYNITDILVADGTLNIGFKTVSSTANWVATDNFRLYYYGIDLTALAEALTALKTEAELIEGIMQTAAETELAEAITEAGTALASPTEQTINAALARLTSAINTAKASIATYASLLAEITAANTYATAHSEFKSIADFTAAITAAQAIYTALEADVATVTAAQATLTAAWKTLRYANSVDLTAKITDAAVTAAANWTGGGINSGQQYTGAPDNTYLDYYSKTYDGYQILSGLPDGEYVLKAAVRASGLGIGSLYASSGEDEWSHPVIGTGNTGNELGGGWYWAEIFDIAVSDGTLQIGIKGDASSNRWIGADDFHLYYIGAAQVKTVLQAAIDNATALLATIDATTMVGASLGQYTQEAYDALTAALTAANAANADETILQEAIDAAATALTNAITAFKASYQMQTNALANGDYYLKTNGYYVADGASAVQNVAPLMQTELNVSGKDQIFTITKETPTGNSVGRYAILSTLTANRNINEGAAFKDGWGTNDHDWRTMNFYYNGTAYAIQSDGSGANNGFWKFDEATTKIATSKRTVMDVTADFIFELITVHTVLSAQVETIRPTFIAAETGTAAGQYPQEVYDAFEAALETADAILAVEGSATAQNLVDFVAAAKLFVPNGTAINTLPTENRVQVTASDKSIEIKAIEPVKATVYTATGRLINETTVSGRQSIPVATGVYIVKTGANITKVIVR